MLSMYKANKGVVVVARDNLPYEQHNVIRSSLTYNDRTPSLECQMQ